MKKILIGTSALVAATAFAGAANAADPIKLSIGGYGAVMVGYASQDDAFLRATGREVTAVDVKGDNEVHLTGKTTLDNGLTVAVKYEIENGGRNSSSDVSDEWSISVSGAFGTIKTGADDNALAMIHNNAPRVGGRLFNGGLAGGDLIAGTYVLAPAGLNVQTDTVIDTNGDSEALSYISPSFAGFTFGASYVADAGQADDTAVQPNGTNTLDAYGVGLGYKGTFGGVTLSADIGWLTGDHPTADDHNEYQAGLNVSFSGFTVGGAYRLIDQDFAGVNTDLDGQVWEAGISYKTGPYAIALAYIDANQEVGRNIADDEAKVWELSTSYNMGPGVDLVGGIGYVSFDQQGTASSGADNDGWVVATGLSLTF